MLAQLSPQQILSAELVGEKIGVVQKWPVLGNTDNRDPARGKGGFDAEMKKTGRVSNPFRVQLKGAETA
jgi:hypothetical protein